MKYRLTTIEQDAAGTVYRVPRPSYTRASLAVVVRLAAWVGFKPGRKFVNGLTIIAVEFPSEETP